MKGQRILKNSGLGINMKGQMILWNSGLGINMKEQMILWNIGLGISRTGQGYCKNERIRDECDRSKEWEDYEW